jgi:hypothetical protein
MEFGGTGGRFGERVKVDEGEGEKEGAVGLNFRLGNSGIVLFVRQQCAINIKRSKSHCSSFEF